MEKVNVKKSLDEVISQKVDGLYYGRRLLLPFVADILKVIVDNEIITDFSSSVKYSKQNYFTEIYFFDYENLREAVSKYEVIKMVVVEEGQYIFDINNHRKIELKLEEKHRLIIRNLEEDILFVE